MLNLYKTEFIIAETVDSFQETINFTSKQIFDKGGQVLDIKLSTYVREEGEHRYAALIIYIIPNQS